MTQKHPTPEKRRSQRPGKKSTPPQAPQSSPEPRAYTGSAEVEQEEARDEDDMVPGEDIAGMQRPPDDS